MLAVAEQAATVIRAIADRPELPEGAGLRIASDTGAPEDLSVAAAATPEDGDQVVDDGGSAEFLVSAR
jgi:iron-sulfur cluster assembly protein